MRQNKPVQQESAPYHQLKDFDTPIEIKMLGGITHCFSV
jgi:hypothetical protein